MKRARLLLAVKAAITIGLLAYLVSQIVAREGMSALGERLGGLDPVAIGVALALHAVSVLAGVARWRTLLDARDLRQPYPWLLRSFLIGRFVGAFTPSTTGLDGWRGYEVARKTGDVAGSAGVILVEKLVGIVGMALVCAALAPIGVIDRLGPGALPMALALASVAVIGVWVLASPARARSLAAIAPRPIRAKVTKLVEALAAGQLSRGRLTKAIGLGIVQHLALSAVFAATGAALHVDVPLGTLLAVGNAIVISVLLPLSIGGVGVREGVAVALLSSSMPISDAALIASLGWLTGQAPALIGGVLLALDRSAPKLRDVAPPAPATTTAPNGA